MNIENEDREVRQSEADKEGTKGEENGKKEE